MGTLIKSGEKMKSGIDYVGVGVGVIILKDGKVLLHRRKNVCGAGTWALPGGHLEVNETFEACAIRETKEEMGVDIKPLKVMSISNNIAYGVHYVTIGVLAELVSGEPKIMEPDKCDAVKWFDLNKLPANIFHASGRVIAHYRGEPLG
jgi:8-oxo-dGTP diphosphatase